MGTLGLDRSFRVEDQSHDHIGEGDSSQGIGVGEDDLEEGRGIRRGFEAVPEEGLVSRNSIDPRISLMWFPKLRNVLL